MMILKDRKCPLCGQEDYKFLFKDKNRRNGLDAKSNYVKCKNCDLVFLNSMPNFKKFEEYNQIYFSKKEKKQKALLAIKIFCLLFEGYNQLFEQSKYYRKLYQKRGRGKNGAKKRILDIGCNDASKLGRYYKYSWEVYGVDLSSEAIKTARRNFPEGHFFCKELEKSGFEENYFDIIRADHLLEHLENPLRFVENCKKYLNARGKLLLYFPNGESFCMRVFKKYNINCWVPFHINLFSEKTVRKMLEKAGFKKIRIYYNTPTVYFILSIKQFINEIRNKNTLDMEENIFEKGLYVFLSPFGALLNKFKLGEELVIIAEK